MELGLKGDPPAGILLIDKPTGMTSHDVVDKVRKKTSVVKVGHTGTLDPLATGILIILVSREFTKRQSEFLKLDKEYVCMARLGIETDTYDIEGKVVGRAKQKKLGEIAEKDLENILKNFRGKITQTVPPYSAVKIKGKKLYDKARGGGVDQSDLPQRRVEIKELELIDFYQDEKTQAVYCSLRVSCGSGTYIRSLVHDIGQVLGVGAVVTSLRRTRIGKYQVKDAMSLQSFVT